MTHNKKGSAYNGMIGIIKHHNDKKSFMINCETNCLCNIKPQPKWKQLLISNI